MLATQSLDNDQKLQLADAVWLVNEGHRVRMRETIDLQPGRSALTGAMWTGLSGLIIGGPDGWIAGLGIGASVAQRRPS